MPDSLPQMDDRQKRLLEVIIIGSLGWKYPLLNQLHESKTLETAFMRQVIDAVSVTYSAFPNVVPKYEEVLQEAEEKWGCIQGNDQSCLEPRDDTTVAAQLSLVGTELCSVLDKLQLNTDLESWTASWLMTLAAPIAETSGIRDDRRLPAFAEGSWQAATVAHLSRELTIRQIEDALGKQFLKALRSWRRQFEQRDTAGTKTELIEALLIQHGADLLRSCKTIRRALGTAAKVVTPDAFHSGKAAAIRFVHAVGLPTELAGIPSSPRPPAAQLVSGPQKLRELEDYQLEAKREIEDALEHGRSVLCSLPTGGGKTRVAIEALVEWIRGVLANNAEARPVIVWAAHTQELCAQAVEAFRAVWEVRASGRTLLLGSTAVTNSLREPLQELMQESWDALVVVTTPIVGAKAIRDAGWFKELNLSVVAALIIDEAHRAAAPTYGRLIDIVRMSSGATRVPVVGLTATPFRTVLGEGTADEATAALRMIFTDGLISPTILGDDPKQVLIARRCLALPTYASIRGTDLSMISTEFTDENSEAAVDLELGKLAGKNLQRRRRVFQLLQRLLEKDPAARVLYFGPTVADAEVMAFLLLNSGFRASALSAKTHASNRRETIRLFKTGAFQVLCNHGVLSTGFDDPRITHVVIARPTVSLVLFEQMVGRGLRGPLFGGTDECHIYAVEDTFAGGASTQRVAQAFVESWTPHIRLRS
jgi:DNA repair protein RadD